MGPPEATSEEAKKPVVIPTASAVLPSGELVEMVYDPIARKTQFVCGAGDAWGYEESILVSPVERLVPYSPTNNLVKHNVVLFPSEPTEYGDESSLVSRIRDFVRRHVEVSDDFEVIATYYVLFTWLYDAFHEVPYVRVRGGYGSGKTRFLLTVGSLCRLPIFASAASTVSPIFRLIDSFRGTLVLDEGDFRYSDEKSEIVKILNNGNAKGFPVLRTEVSSKKEFDPRAYHVFGPKLVATRGFFQDKALESRCVTEDMRGGALRSEIPLNLDESFHEEARSIRNQLLLYRLRHFTDVRAEARAGARDLEPRLQQIFGPLVSVISDAPAREKIIGLIRKYNEDLVDERSEEAEAQVLGVIRDLVARGPASRLAIQDITRLFLARYGDQYERRVTPRWIGSLVRRRLGLRPSRTTGVFMLGPEDIGRLASLYARYGVEPIVHETPSVEKEAALDAGA
ncbi:MAG TPA: hypothetical protein VJ865_07690 [Gemmatimonadaceae bacterium]|nr:hypothetical protein [Gemmatimonadaceae bacterium]